MKRPAIAILFFLSFSLVVALSDPVLGQSLDKMRLGYSGTGLNNYVLEMGVAPVYSAKTDSTSKSCT
jgi:hypothetical protein